QAWPIFGLFSGQRFFLIRFGRVLKTTVPLYTLNFSSSPDDYPNGSQIARDFGLHHSTVEAIRHNKTWKNI
ncbi:MAG: hypothetical protein M0Z36_09240, partial [Thermaerobacter sp.]|nr:hypothetical protein [Thermaerobacter sp.]